MGRLSGGCGEAVWSGYGSCLDVLGRLYRGCGMAVWGEYVGSLDSVWKVSGGV